MVGTVGLFPVGECLSIDDRMYIDGYIRIAASLLSVDPPWVEFYKAQAWAHKGCYSPAHPGVVYVRVGQTMAHTVATALHETAHLAGIDSRTGPNGSHSRGFEAPFTNQMPASR
jgi:hypothetical protein